MRISSTKTTLVHLGLVVTTAVFSTHDVREFNALDNLGLNTKHARNPSAKVVAENKRQNRILQNDYTLYHKVDNGLKGLLFTAVPHVYVQLLQHATLGFRSSTNLQILTHLWTTYGNIDGNMLAANLVEIATP